MKRFLLLVTLIAAGFSAMGSQAIEVNTSGKGDHILIIAGFGGMEPWRETIEQLSESNTCHLITIRGIDGTTSSDSLNIDAVVNEILEFIVINGIEKPVIMGHSFGGFIAMKLAAENALVAGKLVIIDSFPFAMALMDEALTCETGKQQAQMYRQQIMALPDQHYHGFWMQNVQQLVSDKNNQDLIHQSVVSSQRSSIVEAQCAMFGNDLRPQLNTIDCPVLVLCSMTGFLQAGLDAELIRQRINQQFNNLSSCSIFIHNNSRHFIMLDDMQWMVDKIQQFI